MRTGRDSPHPCAIDGSARPAERPVSTAVSRRSLIRPPWPMAATRDENRAARLSSALLVRQSPLLRGRFSFQDGVRRPSPQGYELSGSLTADSWPVTLRDPELGTNTDSEPVSQRTVISRPSTAVTTPLRVTLPTFSDSTRTWSPTSTIRRLHWTVTSFGHPSVP